MHVAWKLRIPSLQTAEHKKNAVCSRVTIFVYLALFTGWRMAVATMHARTPYCIQTKLFESLFHLTQNL
jgi:hypothetical protein